MDIQIFFFYLDIHELDVGVLSFSIDSVAGKTELTILSCIDNWVLYEPVNGVSHENRVKLALSSIVIQPVTLIVYILPFTFPAAYIFAE